jgi:hypothetical protein
MIYGRIGNVEGHKGRKNTLGGSVATQKNAIKWDGDQYDYTRGYRCKEMNKHHGQSNTIGQRYSHFER